MSRRRDAAFVGACAVLVACTRRAPPDPTTAADAEVGTRAHPSDVAHRPGDAGVDERGAAAAAAASADNLAALDDDAGAAAAEPYVTSVPKAAKSIGNTSIVFKVTLTNEKKLAFKPHSRRGPGRYKGEIAAFRLARALALPNVTPAWFRTFRRDELAAALDEDGRKILEREVLDDAGAVRGAVIPWIDGYKIFPLEKEPLFSEVLGWLARGATIPKEREDLAREASNLIAFDFLTANWDRWSGGNVATAGESATLLFVDNDGAFFEAPPKDALARNRRTLARVDRFSRALVERLRALSDDALAAVFGDEQPGTPLLSKKAIDGVLARWRELVQLIDSKIDDGGDREVLFFR